MKDFFTVFVHVLPVLVVFAAICGLAALATRRGQ